MTDTAREEAILWEQFREGDAEVLAILFERLYERLSLYGYKLAGDKTLVEDCVQELFSDLLQKRPVPQVEFVRAYLFKSLRYKLIRVAERRRSQQRHESQLEYHFYFENLEPAEEDPQTEIRRQQLLKTMEALSHRQREIIYLRYYQNLEYEEIAEVMELNYQTSRNLLYKAVKSLRAKWGKE